MSVEHDENSEGFLRRWSRLKRELSQPAPQADPRAPAKTDARKPPAQLPPLDKLTLDSDYSGFFHPKVDEDMRRAALRRLFSDPHFNVMDGLDVYIDDYSKSEPLPAATLASMKQAQRILDCAAGKKDETAGDEPAARPIGETADAPPALEVTQPDPEPQDVAQPEVVAARKT